MFTFRSLFVVCFYLFLSGCMQQGAPQSDNLNNDVSEASKAAYKAWAFCVFRSSDALADGSSDVTLIVDTALGQCKNELHGWQSNLARNDLNSDFVKSYYRSAFDGTRNQATARVLKKKAAQQRQ